MNGATRYQITCAQCHGAILQGGNAQRFVDGVWHFGGLIDVAVGPDYATNSWLYDSAGKSAKRVVVVAIHPQGVSSTLHHNNSDNIYGAGCAKIDLSVPMLETLLPDMPVLILSRCRRAAVNIVEHLKTITA